MAKSTSIYDVAKLAGVSPSTVSRVINNDPRISSVTLQNVLKVMQESGYIPRKASQRQGARRKPRQSRRYNQIALLYGMSREALNSSVYAQVLQELVDTARANELNLVLSRCLDRENADCLPDKIDGVVLFGVKPEGRLLRKIRQVAAVRVMGLISGDDIFDHVSYNNKKIGTLAAQYLLEHNCRKYYTLRVDQENQLIYQRTECFINALQKAGAQFGLLDLDNPIIPSAGIEGNSEPLGLFTPEDARLIRIFPTLSTAGYIPQKNLVIVSCNNDRNILNNINPEIVSIDINCRQVGHDAVEHLVKKIAAPEGFREKIIVEPFLAVGASDSE